MVNGTREVFEYLRCGGCGTLYLASPPKDLSKYYANYYSTGSRGETVVSRSVFHAAKDEIKEKIKGVFCRLALRSRGKISNWILNRWARIPPYLGFESLRALRLRRTDRILDVGCGPGHIIELLDRIGFKNCTGCDPFIPAEIQFKNGSRLIKAGVEEMPGLWQLIMLHHCFEHVPDPRATIRIIDSKLIRDGICILRFPNVDSVEFDRYGENWWGIHAPRHFFLLSREGMENVLRNTGLKIEKVWCDSQPDHYAYSSDYAADIPDNDPRSSRTGNSPHAHLDWAHIHKELPILNAGLVGDWIVYQLRKT